MPALKFCGGVNVSPAAENVFPGSLQPMPFVEGFGVAVNVGMGSPTQNAKGPFGTTTGRGYPLVTFIVTVDMAEHPLLLVTVTVYVFIPVDEKPTAIAEVVAPPGAHE